FGISAKIKGLSRFDFLVFQEKFIGVIENHVIFFQLLEYFRIDITGQFHVGFDSSTIEYFATIGGFENRSERIRYIDWFTVVIVFHGLNTTSTGNIILADG